MMGKMKNIAIIDSLPAYDWNKVILEIGCGDGKLSFLLARMGHVVHAVDIKEYDSWYDTENLTFCRGDIFDLSSIPLKSASVVIASEVLEHLPGWKIALVNLIALASVRLIITIPWMRSFMCDSHINFWADQESILPGQHKYKHIGEFFKICSPYSTSIQKIRTKPEDVSVDQYAYLIIIDKRQGLNE